MSYVDYDAGTPPPVPQRVYAAATVLYEMLTLRNPSQGAFVPASELHPGLDDAFDLVIEKARQPQPDDRYPTMADFHSELAQVMLRDSLDAYVRHDLGLARKVLGQDDELDALKTHVFRDLLACMLRDAATIEPSLDLILISRLDAGQPELGCEQLDPSRLARALVSAGIAAGTSPRPGRRRRWWSSWNASSTRGNGEKSTAAGASSAAARRAASASGSATTR